MIATTRASFTAKILTCVALVASAPLLPTAVAAAVSPPAYQAESLATYEQQLAGGQIASVTVNKRLRSLRVTLKDGSYVLAKYNPKGEPAAVAALEAKHVPVTVLSPTEAKKEVPKKAVHHKLRYVAAAIVIVVIVIVGAVLYISRKRQFGRD
jgi:hypothetical protein